jgi:hypothetical protein
MSEIMAGVKTINSLVRTLIILVVMGAAGVGAWFGYDAYIEPSLKAKQALADLERLRVDYEQQEKLIKEIRNQNEKLTTSLKLLKVDRRVANVEVLEKGVSETGEPFLEVRFTEVNDQGNAVGTPRDFTLRGDRLYVDCWIVKFEDKYVEQADALRSASLCVFKSIFGDLDGPAGSKPLDGDSSSRWGPPGIYNDDQKTAFEEKIWSDFWNVCNSPKLQKEYGIRASHGDAIYVKGDAGKTYQVKIRSSGSASLEPLE